MEEKDQSVMQTVQLLLSMAGVEVNAINNDGLTALDVFLQRRDWVSPHQEAMHSSLWGDFLC